MPTTEPSSVAATPTAKQDPEEERNKKKARIFELAKARGFNLKLGSELEEFEYVPIGLPNFDTKGGACRGRFIVMFGPAGSTKTTLVYRMIAAFQKKFPDQSCLLISPERRNSPSWMATQGVSLDDLLILEDAEALEDYCEAALRLIKTGSISFVAVDTVSMMMPRGYLSKEDKPDVNLMDKELVALDARKIGQWIRMTNGPIFSTNTACVLVSQARTHGIGSRHAYIDLSGGHMQRHMANQIWQMTPMTSESDAVYKLIDTGEGKKVKVCTSFKVKALLKKDTGPNTGRIAYLDFRPGVGFDDALSVTNSGVFYGIVTKPSAAIYSWTDSQGVVQNFHGKPKVIEYFQANSPEKDRLAEMILKAYHDSKGTKEDETPVEGEWVDNDEIRSDEDAEAGEEAEGSPD